MDYNWDENFTQLFGKCLDLYRSGNTDYRKYYSPEDYAFLKTIGYKPIEFFDFVEDFERHGEPSISVAVMIAAVRRDYLKVVMKGELSNSVFPAENLPEKQADTDGIAWLPRIVKKAQLKLRGEMPDEIMYCCGGDRKFLKHFDFHPADFLRLVWAANEEENKITEFIKMRAKTLGVDAQYKVE